MLSKDDKPTKQPNNHHKFRSLIVNILTGVMYIFSAVAIFSQVEIIYIVAFMSENNDLDWPAQGAILRMGLSIVVVIVCLVIIREQINNNRDLI